MKVTRHYIIQEENLCEISVELNICEKDKQYTTSLDYWKTEPDKQIKNYPRAIGKHLFGLEIDDKTTETKPEVLLTIEQNDLGKPFFLKLDQETSIDGLGIRFDYSAIKWKVPYTSEEAMYEVVVTQIKLSENGEEYIISFDSDSKAEKGELLFH